MARPSEIRRLGEMMQSQSWRLCNLYYIIDKRGSRIKFVPNFAQADLYNNRHNFNVILKARQLGMSTFLMILALDECLFRDNYSAGVIAHTREDSENLFKNKVKFAYDNLPDFIKEEKRATSDSARKLEFSNGSSITVGTSLRGGTFQFLHVSEYGKISARYPEKAVEIKTGALNTIHGNQSIFIESTAEGNSGEFYELCQRALRLEAEGVELTELDPKLHFYPWYKDPSYVMEANVSVTDAQNKYFNGLGVQLSPEQKVWYVKKSEQQGEHMKREFPSTAEEAFEQSMEGAIYQREMQAVRENGGISEWLH